MSELSTYRGLTNLSRNVMLNLVNIQTHNHITQNILGLSIYPPFAIATTKLCYIIKRFDSQVIVLRDIYNSYYVLEEYSIYALNINRAADRRSITVIIFCTTAIS